jgi:hypothetical protein
MSDDDHIIKTPLPPEAFGNLRPMSPEHVRREMGPGASVLVFIAPPRAAGRAA